MLDLLTDMLEQAKRRGATAGDAFVVGDQSFSAQVRLGQVDTVKHAREQHLALRVFVGKSVAAASTSDLSGESVARLVEEAVSLARITSPDELSGLPDRRSPRSRRAAARSLRPDGARPRARGEDRSRAPRGSGGTRRPTRGSRTPKAATSPTAARAMPTRRVTASPASTRPRRSRSRRRRSPSQDGEMQRDGWYHVTRKRARLDLPGRDRARSRRQRALRRLGARRVKTAEVPVIFDPDMAGESGSPHRGRGLGPLALPGRVVPGGQARSGHRVALGDHRRRRHDSGRARLAALRRRGPAGAAHRRRRSRRARLLSARHVQRQEARDAVDASRRPRRQRGQRAARPICTSPPARPIPAS